MAQRSAVISRPQRWDTPFDPDMAEADVDRVLSIEPFSQIDPERFPTALPLHKLILNDCRIVRARPGDIIVREGDYGSSLFFIMAGTVRVAIDSMPARMLGRREPARKGLLRTIAQLWTNHRTTEYRDVQGYVAHGAGAAQRGEGEQARIFLQDVPAVLDEHRTATISDGSFFGELAALARIPRTATVFAETDCELLEMRWQGFRDIRRRSEAIRDHVDQLYRERSLKSQLLATDMFRDLSEAELDEVADQITFETFGEFDWYGSFKRLPAQDPARRLAHEPIIAEQGHYPDGLILIRAGFARVSCKYGDGERTISYLGRGQSYGFEELAEAFQRDRAVPFKRTIRALGYVDILRVPTVIVEKYILSRRSSKDPNKAERSSHDADRRWDQSPARIETGMLEFLVENRFINGASTMLIDLNRCTGCDDCVRACAEAHDGNPRFIRHGKQFDHYLVANACMHCADPVCMIGCPTGAIHRDLQGGEVVINDLTCIGCATCANSCPYHNIRMVEIRDETGDFVLDEHSQTPILKATKCDLSVDQPGDPPCQRACPHDALVRLDMMDTRAVERFLNR